MEKIKKLRKEEEKANPKQESGGNASIFSDFLSENFGDIMNKHSAGGFKDSGKEGMTIQEARQILQFDPSQPNISKSQILDNFRHISKVNHPDLGGSAFISAKVNEAKETML